MQNFFLRGIFSLSFVIYTMFVLTCDTQTEYNTKHLEQHWEMYRQRGQIFLLFTRPGTDPMSFVTLRKHTQSIITGRFHLKYLDRDFVFNFTSRFHMKHPQTIHDLFLVFFLFLKGISYAFVYSMWFIG